MLLLWSRHRKNRYRSMPRDGRDSDRQMAGMDVPWIVLSRQACRSAGSAGPFRAGAFLTAAGRRRDKDFPMRLVLISFFILSLTAGSEAACVCRCVDGEMQPLCHSSVDVPPVCPVTVCAIVPPSVRPVQPLGLPPLGTSQCSQRQVLNPTTRQYEWRNVCN